MRSAAALLLLASCASASGWASSDDLLRKTMEPDQNLLKLSMDKVAGQVSVCAVACRDAYDGKPLREGDVLKTGADGRADVVVDGAGRLRVLADTEVQVGGGKSGCGFKLIKGAVLSALDNGDCEVGSAQASAPTRDSRFRVAYGDGGVAQFVVAGTEARLVAKNKPRALLSRWWAGKAPTRAKVPESAEGAVARFSGVVLRSEAGGAPEAVDEGASVSAGDELETPPSGWASVALADGFAAVLAAGSKVGFQKRDGKLALALLKGRLYVARLRPGTNPPPIVVAGASSALEGSDEFEIGVDEHSGMADFAVFTGELAVRSAAAQAAGRP